jgi:uncharacterized membrane protein YdcZ (DUF606 family)
MIWWFTLLFFIGPFGAYCSKQFHDNHTVLPIIMQYVMGLCCVTTWFLMIRKSSTNTKQIIGVVLSFLGIILLY